MQQSSDAATGTLEAIGERDHEITSEYRIFGPPGTGKTTSLSRQITRAVEKYGAQSILVTSFSRAAAAELAGRDLPIASDRIGTLHSHCFHALNGPEIAEANVEDWNKDNPQLALTPIKKQGKLDGEESIDDDDETEKDGDELLQKLNRFRGKMIPHKGWPAEAVVPGPARRSRYRGEDHSSGQPPAGEGLPPAFRGRPVPALHTRRLPTTRNRDHSGRGPACRTWQDRDAAGLVLLHAPAGRRGASFHRHPVP